LGVGEREPVGCFSVTIDVQQSQMVEPVMPRTQSAEVRDVVIAAVFPMKDVMKLDDLGLTAGHPAAPISAAYVSADHGGNCGLGV